MKKIVELMDALDGLHFGLDALNCIETAREAHMDEKICNNAAFFVRMAMERMIAEVDIENSPMQNAAKEKT